MAICEIMKGRTNDLLRKKARKVEKINKRVLTILDDMAETLKNAGGNGLAAPQIGVSLRLIVVKIEMSYIMLINPVIVKSAGEQLSLEGCLSLPGIYGKVKRPELIIIEALDTNGKKTVVRATHQRAAIVAHEMDHLEGILMIDKALQVVKQNK